jgi:hypothetical protein
MPGTYITTDDGGAAQSLSVPIAGRIGFNETPHENQTFTKFRG